MLIYQGSTNVTIGAISTAYTGFFDIDFLNDVIEQLWRMDNDRPCEKSLSQDEQQYVAYFVQNIQTNGKGRLLVKFPLDENFPVLAESKQLAY